MRHHLLVDARDFKEFDVGVADCDAVLTANAQVDFGRGIQSVLSDVELLDQRLRVGPRSPDIFSDDAVGSADADLGRLSLLDFFQDTTSAWW